MRVRGGFCGLLAALISGRMDIDGFIEEPRRLDRWTEKKQREAERYQRQLDRLRNH